MINDLKDFEKLLKICRKQGVLELSLGTLSVKLGDLPTKEASSSEESDEIQTEALTPEQMMFYAVGNQT